MKTEYSYTDEFILRCIRSGKYEATADGAIVNNRFYRRGEVRVVATRKNTSGYLMCSLNLNGEDRTCLVHRIILFALLGEPRFCEMEGNHKNGRKDDNRLANLEWATKSENISHAFRTGLKSWHHVPQHGI